MNYKYRVTRSLKSFQMRYNYRSIEKKRSVNLVSMAHTHNEFKVSAKLCLNLYCST